MSNRRGRNCRGSSAGKRYCCNPIKMSPCAHNRNVPSGSGSWSAPSPSRLMMATPRDPSRVREAKPYGLALDCSLAAAKTALGSTRRMGLRARRARGHFYWATKGDISIVLQHRWKAVRAKPHLNPVTLVRASLDALGTSKSARSTCLEQRYASGRKTTGPPIVNRIPQLR